MLMLIVPRPGRGCRGVAAVVPDRELARGEPHGRGGGGRLDLGRSPGDLQQVAAGWVAGDLEGQLEVGIR
jgi:hypothetical protein